MTSPLSKRCLYRGALCLTGLTLIVISGCSRPQSRTPQEASPLQSDSIKAPSAEQASLGLTECQDECESWTLLKQLTHLCKQPVAVYQQTEIPSDSSEQSGGETRWALLIAPINQTSISPPKTPRLDQGWRVLWEGVMFSEMIPRGAGEAVTTRGQLIADTVVDEGYSLPCRPFTIRSELKARSFHRVDARESEFDEATVDEVRFEFDPTRRVYLSSPEEEIKIKVRDH